MGVVLFLGRMIAWFVYATPFRVRRWCRRFVVTRTWFAQWNLGLTSFRGRMTWPCAYWTPRWGLKWFRRLGPGYLSRFLPRFRPRYQGQVSIAIQVLAMLICRVVNTTKTFAPRESWSLLRSQSMHGSFHKPNHIQPPRDDSFTRSHMWQTVGHRHSGQPNRGPELPLSVQRPWRLSPRALRGELGTPRYDSSRELRTWI